MRRIITIALVALVGSALIGLSVAAARPSWLPSWVYFKNARPDVGLDCKEHGVPEKFCTICHEELASTLMLCTEHGGLPEDICTLCYPDVKELYDLKMCAEHGLPEAFCAQCGNGPGAASDGPDDGWCSTHNMPEALCSRCLTDPASHETDAARVCRQSLPLVRLETASLAGEIGLETAQIRQVRHAHTLPANAETAFDANHFAEVRPRVLGFLREVKVDLGQQVQDGDILCIVDSAEISAAKSRFLEARDLLELANVTYERTSKLAKTGAIASKTAFEDLTARNQARAREMDAIQKLRNLGFSDPDIERIASDRDTTSLLPITAPVGGTVVRRHAVQGEAVEPATLLFSVSDTSRIWLWIDVYEADIASVQVGRPVEFSVSDGDGSSLSGQVTWVGAEVDPKTRTTRVRAELDNPSGLLRANQFGVARIQVGDEHDALLLPSTALQRKDGADLVFLPQGNGVYRPQRIQTTPSDRDHEVEVLWGLKPGDQVVTTGSYLLKTEIMKGAIGAGCCD